MSAVQVELTPGWKCERCRKVLPEVGLCEDHPTLCLRCVVVVEPSIEIDIHGWAAARFDRLLRDNISSGMTLQEATRRAGDENAGRLKRAEG